MKPIPSSSNTRTLRKPRRMRHPQRGIADKNQNHDREQGPPPAGGSYTDGNCTLNGISTSCGFALGFVGNGSACIGSCSTSITGSNGKTYQAVQTAGPTVYISRNGSELSGDSIAELGLPPLGLGFSPFANGGAGGAPSNAQIIKRALSQKRLHSCSQTLFGNGNALNAANAPGIQYLSPSQMSAYLGGYLGASDAAGANNPAKNTVYFNRSVFGGNLPSIYYQSNYLHEAGNIISFNLYGNETAKGNMFVGQNEYPIDPDSGASFERCIFGKRMQIP